VDAIRTLRFLWVLLAILLWLDGSQPSVAGDLSISDPAKMRIGFVTHPDVSSTLLLQTAAPISKTAPSEIIAGDLLTYTILISDTNGTISAIVTDTVPANSRYLAESMASSPPEATITFTAPTPLDAGSVMSWTIESPTSPVTLTFAVAPILPITDGMVITNEAWLSGTTSSIATTTVRSAPSLHFAKTGQPAVVIGGGLLTYTLTVSNTGPGIAINTVVTDTVPAHTAYQPNSMATIPADTATISQPIAFGPGNVMTWTLPFLSGAVSLTFQVAVDRPITDGTAIANTAWLLGEPAVATSTVSATPNLHLVKTVSPSAVRVGELLTYTLTLSNDGTGIAQGVVLTDRLPAGEVFTNMIQGETPAATSPELTWNDLTVATSHVLTFKVTAPLRSGSYFNQAAATFDGIRLETGPSAVVQVTSITRTLDLPIIYKNYQCTPDPYEGPSGNNSAQTAYQLASNTTLFANFCGDPIVDNVKKDEYKFSVSGAGVPIRATLSQIPSGCDYDLYLYSMTNLNTPKATSKRPGGQDEAIQYQPQPSEAGEFLLLVDDFSKCSPAGVNDYRLDVIFE
jgi:uncharacterized repeat protein (TIGR01451 family)